MDSILSVQKETEWWLDNGWSQSPQWGKWITEQSPVRCHRTRSCHSMIQSYPCKTKSHETEKSLSTLLETSHRPKVVYTDNSLEFGKSCEDLSWNHRTSTPHRSETHGIAERAVRRLKEVTSSILLQWDLDENGGQILWNAVAVCEMSKTSWHGKTHSERRFGEPFQRTSDSCWGNGWMLSDSCTRPTKTSPIWPESAIWYLSWYELIAGGIWKGYVMTTDIEELEMMDASENSSSKNQRERSIDVTKKKDEFKPVEDGTAQMSGRDCDFREPTPRREQTERSEDFSWELQGEPGESQPTESTDDADFWSIQGDLFYRHHNELRVQLHVPKEETFPIPLKHIDVTRSTHTALDVMQEKLVDDFRNVNSNRSLSDSWAR